MFLQKGISQQVEKTSPAIKHVSFFLQLGKSLETRHTSKKNHAVLRKNRIFLRKIAFFFDFPLDNAQ